MSETAAPYTPPQPARATAQTNAALYPSGQWTEGQQSRLDTLQLDYFGMRKRALAAEARVQELLAELAGQEVEKMLLLVEADKAKQERACAALKKALLLSDAAEARIIHPYSRPGQ